MIIKRIRSPFAPERNSHKKGETEKMCAVDTQTHMPWVREACKRVK